jgi:hypothetical protein
MNKMDMAKTSLLKDQERICLPVLEGWLADR